LTKKTLSQVACADIDHCVSHYANSTVTLFTIALNILLIVARHLVEYHNRMNCILGYILLFLFWQFILL